MHLFRLLLRQRELLNKLYLQMLDISEKAFGPEHPATASSLSNLAELYRTMGSYDKAELLYKRALAIREKVLGPEHPLTASSLNNLAGLYQTIGAYEKAEPLYKRALTILEKVLGLEHPSTATSLNNLGALYKAMGAYEKAEPLHKRALMIREKILGPEHRATAVSLDNLAGIYYEKGAYDKAEPLFKRALEINEKVLGPEHPDTATSLNNLGEIYTDLGAYNKAEQLHKRALTIREKVLGPKHPDIASSLNNLAGLYYEKGAYEKAELLYKRALTIREKVLGPEHPDTATSLNNLAALYQAMGTYEKAEPLLKQALVINEKVLGSEHPSTATSINLLGELYNAMGAYDKAEPLYKRSLTIREKVLGPEHPFAASSLTNLAAFYETMGAYDKAEPLYNRALTIREKVLGPEHPLTASSLNSLAGLYKAMGAYEKAEPLYKRSLVIDEKVLGPEHRSTVSILNNLAGLYYEKGAYEKAEPLYKQALAINEKVLGPEHPDTARSLNNLAALYEAMGAYEKAEPLHKRALTIRENVFGPEHPSTAISLNNLAALYEAMGAYEKADPLYKRALTIREKVLGPEHPETANSLDCLSASYWAQGRFPEAAAIRKKYVKIYDNIFQRLLGVGNESRKLSYIATRKGNTSATISYSLASRSKVMDADLMGLTEILQVKGQVLDVLTDTLATARRSLTPEDQMLFDAWRKTNSQYATLVLRGPDNIPLQQYQELFDRLRDKVEILETRLSEKMSVFRTQREAVTVERVTRTIPKDTVLIEWYRYRPFIPNAKEKKSRWGIPRYVAYLLTSEGKPVAVDMGDAGAIEAVLTDLLVALRDADSTNVAELARKLDEKLMQPLRPHLGKVRHLLISPDGMLNLLPFGTLMDAEQHYQAEKYLITYLTSGRDLLRAAETVPSRQGPVVFANPDFGPVAKDTAAVTATESRRSVSLRQGAMIFTPLTGTAAEAAALKTTLSLKDSQVYTKDRATKTAVKQLKGPRILHIATHGFFREDQVIEYDKRSQNIAGGESLHAPKGENPLVRSGLALAGANQLNSGQDNGVLTALEMAGLDLSGTELAVLSACETGVGEVQNGEGIYGLRRALVLAGVQTQVTSLWKVDDEATRDLMVDYYQRLQAGTGRSEALWEAQMKMLKNPARSHPFYWASFIAIGEERPLGR